MQTTDTLVRRDAQIELTRNDSFIDGRADIFDLMEGSSKTRQAVDILEKLKKELEETRRIQQEIIDDIASRKRVWHDT